MTAAPLFHLVKDHPFVEGNKRIGLAVTIAFLGLNDFYLVADEDEIVELVLGIAEGRFGKAEAALFIRACRTA